MASNESNGPTYYNWTFRHGVDEKRRLQVPAKWRPAGDVEFTLIIWPKGRHGACLRALPPAEMANLLKEIQAMPSSDTNKVVLKRLIGSQSMQVAVDKAGRICLPEEMAKAAGIDGEAVLVGLIDRFEIWNPERRAAVEQDDQVLAEEAFKMME